MKKKVIIGIIIIVVIIFTLAIITNYIDSERVTTNHEPKFCIKTISSDGSKVTYWGLGYKVIRYVGVSPNEPYESNIGAKMGSWFMKYDLPENNYKVELKAVVVKVNEKSMLVMEKEKANELISVGFTDEGNIGFKQGQEIVIYFDGMIMESYPAQIGNVQKIEIVREKSNIEIPDNILRYCYSSKENVVVSINDFAKSRISFNIEDKNELPYTYSNDYKIYKKVKNKDYTGIGHKIGEDTENSTAGFTGTGSEYIWEEVEKTSDMESKNTIEDLRYNLQNKNENEHYTAIGKECDWTKLYGELNEGEYEFVFSTEGSFHIRIKFEINKNGELSYSKPVLE